MLLQLLREDIIRDVANVVDTPESMANSIIESNSVMVSLLILLSINVVIMILNFVLDTIKHRKDNHNYKVHLIAKKGVEVESAIYDMFLKLSAIPTGDEHSLLDAILKIDSYLINNRIYIEKRYMKVAIEFLDYFKKIQYKMPLKDIKEEEAFFEKMSKAFYGE